MTGLSPVNLSHEIPVRFIENGLARQIWTISQKMKGTCLVA